MSKKLAVMLCIGIVALSSTACNKKKNNASSSTTTTSAPAAAQVTKGDKSSFYEAATPQKGDGKTIKVDEAVFTGTSGWVAIHSDAGGAPGPVLGVSKLIPAGTTDNIVITLDKPLTASATVWPMLHLEDNNNTTYDFPNGDQPAKVGPDVVVFPIAITVS